MQPTITLLTANFLPTTRPTTARPQSTNSATRILNIGIALAAIAMGSGAHAAVNNYVLVPAGSQYERTVIDTDTGFNAADTFVNLVGGISIDTATGALVAANFSLGNYTEYYSYSWDYASNHAQVDHFGESQTIGTGVNGNVAGTVISFSGANSWSSALVGGSVSCSDSAGPQGNATCTAATSPVTAWSPFAIQLLFAPDFSAFTASASWGDSSVNNSLSLFAIQQAPTVPIPGSIWLMGSGVAGLLSLKRRLR